MHDYSMVYVRKRVHFSRSQLKCLISKGNKFNRILPVLQEPHRNLDYMLHVLVLDHNLVSDWRCKFVAMQYFSLMLIASEWLELCLADRLFVHISVAMDSGYYDYCIVMGNLNFTRKKCVPKNRKEKKARDRERK